MTAAAGAFHQPVGLESRQTATHLSSGQSAAKEANAEGGRRPAERIRPISQEIELFLAPFFPGNWPRNTPQWLINTEPNPAGWNEQTLGRLESAISTARGHWIGERGSMGQLKTAIYTTPVDGFLASPMAVKQREDATIANLDKKTTSPPREAAAWVLEPR